SDAVRIADLETIEIGDDGVARTVSGTPSGGTVTFAPVLSAASASGVRVDHWGSNTDVDIDLSLAATSACVDVGDDSAVPGEITTDIAGDSRFVDSPGVGNTGTDIVDMGAYEHQP
ncbi:MAG: hypothetical protein GY854_03955, partial [Deltaproteobacteria bacterium]|nr:hypothetical protein [Deltaproteobacteria bacterium]